MDPKSYLVLARKYRPQTFDEVIGQDAVATTLKNAITYNRIGHAYLFTGPRGVGKTSMARIFAKALNCKTGPTVTPCGKCPACLEIEGARALDVLEIDGASNRGIDEIRALRENVRFAPAAGKFKIYIIDEVHQITTDGFNALLKTLEEPPAHVKFIFATTSSQKVPATILSRCQRFDFRRIPSETIASVLKEICKKEKLKADDEALYAIAQAADGSLRDSQSILDQMASWSEGKITKADVVRSLGSLEEEKLFEIVDALAKKDAASALLALDKTLAEGKDPALFLEKLIEHTRNLLVIGLSEKLSSLIDATESYKKSLVAQKNALSREDLFYFFTVLSHSLQTMKRFEAKRIPLEMALAKLASREPMENLSSVLGKLSDAQKKTPKIELTASPAPAAPATARPEPPKFASYVTKEEPKDEEEEEDAADIEELPTGDIPVAVAPSERDAAALNGIWDALIRNLKAEKISVASYLAEGEPASLEKGLARVLFPERLNFHKECLETNDNRKLIENHLSKLLAADIRIKFETVKEISPRNATAAENPAAKPVADGVINSAMNMFGGKMLG